MKLKSSSFGKLCILCKWTRSFLLSMHNSAHQQRCATHVQMLSTNVCRHVYSPTRSIPTDNWVRLCPKEKNLVFFPGGFAPRPPFSRPSASRADWIARSGCQIGFQIWVPDLDSRSRIQIWMADLDSRSGCRIRMPDPDPGRIEIRSSNRRSLRRL